MYFQPRITLLLRAFATTSAEASRVWSISRDCVPKTKTELSASQPQLLLNTTNGRGSNPTRIGRSYPHSLSHSKKRTSFLTRTSHEQYSLTLHSLIESTGWGLTQSLRDHLELTLMFLQNSGPKSS